MTETIGTREVTPIRSLNPPSATVEAQSQTVTMLIQGTTGTMKKTATTMSLTVDVPVSQTLIVSDDTNN